MMRILPQDFSGFKYVDDEEFLTREVGSVDDLKINVMPLQNGIKKSSCRVGVLVSVETPDKANSRAGVDLVCALDISQSMEGEKLKTVQDSIEMLMDYLEDCDRLSIVVFNHYAHRLFPLISMNDQNKQKVRNHLATLKANGSTILKFALDLSIKILDERQYINDTCAIFFLTDGQDQSRRKLDLCEYSKKINHLTLHTFGFGADHDANILASLSLIGKGTYQFVSNINLLPQFFIACMGLLQSTIGVKFDLEIISDVRLYNMHGYGYHIHRLDGVRVYKPQIYLGQTRHYVVEFQYHENDFTSDTIKLAEINLEVENLRTKKILKHSEVITLQVCEEVEQIRSAQLIRLQLLIQENIWGINQSCFEKNWEEAEYMVESSFKAIKQLDAEEYVQELTVELQRAKDMINNTDKTKNVYSQHSAFITLSQQGVQTQVINGIQDTVRLQKYWNSRQQQLNDKYIKSL